MQRIVMIRPTRVVMWTGRSVEVIGEASKRVPAEHYRQRALVLDAQLMVAHGDLVQLYLGTGRLAEAEPQLQRMRGIAGGLTRQRIHPAR